MTTIISKQQLDKFYRWIRHQPPLFVSNSPFAQISDIPMRTDLAPEQYSDNPRLGFIYQSLATHAFRQSSMYTVKMEEVQLNHEGQTIGAIDLVLDNQVSKQCEHWELAIKFYLLHGEYWYGPNAYDRLDKKVDRMINHQLMMSETESFKAQFPTITDVMKRLLLQGRLYINPFLAQDVPTQCLGHDINNHQISGFWCHMRDWKNINEPLYELTKPEWAIGADQFNTPIRKPSGKFVHAQTKTGQFWFIVDNDWPNNALSRTK